MRPLISSIATILFVLQLWQPQDLQSRPGGPALRQITNHPSADLWPAPSPDGRWVAFCSKRSGNWDIWLKSLHTDDLFPLTTHPSADMQPIWHPSGESIFFVSRRRDARGDIWRLSLLFRGNSPVVRGNAEPVTERLGLEADPAVSPGGRFLFFSADWSGRFEVWLKDLKKNRFVQVSSEGGSGPSVSPGGSWLAFTRTVDGTVGNSEVCLLPLQYKDGKEKKGLAAVDHFPMPGQPLGEKGLGLPVWGDDDQTLFCSRWMLDTNHDGAISADDSPSLWRISLTIDSTGHPGLEDLTQVTPWGFEDAGFAPGGEGAILFASRRSDNWDVWAMPSDGPLAHARLTDLGLVCEFFPPIDQSTTTDNFNRLLALELLGRRPRDSVRLRAETGIEIARTQAALGYPGLADSVLNSIIAEPSLPAALEAETAFLRIRLAHAPGMSRADLLSAYVELIKTYPDATPVVARAFLEMGDAHRRSGAVSKALLHYHRALDAPYDEVSATAISALFRVAETYREIGQRDEAERYYAEVIARHPEAELDNRAALDSLTGMYRAGDLQEQIAQLRALIERRRDQPRIAAAAQLQIGRALAGAQRLDSALRELALVADFGAGTEYEQAEAGIQRALLHLRQGDDFEASEAYTATLGTFGPKLGGAWTKDARSRLAAALVAHGERLLGFQEWDSAYLRYRRAIKLDHSTLEAHRGNIECLFRLGRIDDAVNYYERWQDREPDNAAAAYLRGLAYSYKATEAQARGAIIAALDVSLLKRSNALISEALQRNPRLIYGYLTLGFNYEQLETHHRWRAAQVPGFWTRVRNTIVAPLVSVFNTITLRKEPPPPQWIERAIDIQTLGLQINDERLRPGVEAKLAGNLASDHYALGEFGAEKAYQHYLLRLRYDSTFATLQQEALFYERMGHCAYIIDDFERGPEHLKHALELFDILDDAAGYRRSHARLALLYQNAEMYEESTELFQEEIEWAVHNPNALAPIYRNIAYNYLLLHDGEEAIRFAERALSIVESDDFTGVRTRRNWLKIGILGWYFPIKDFGQVGAIQSSAAEGFTADEERALLYTVMGEAYRDLSNFDEAVRSIEKKLEIITPDKSPNAAAIIENNLGYLHFLKGDLYSAWLHTGDSYFTCVKNDLIAGRLTNAIVLGRLALMLESTGDAEGMIQVNARDTRPAGFFAERGAQYCQESLEAAEALGLGYYRQRMALRLALAQLALRRASSVAPTDSTRAAFEADLFELDRLSTAAEYYRAALAEAQPRKWYRDMCLIHAGLGDVSLAALDLEAAHEHLTAALELAEKRGFDEILWRVHRSLGVLSEAERGAEGRAGLDDPLDHYSRAVQVLDELPASVMSPVNPAQRREVVELYERVIAHCMARGLKEEALDYAEGYRARRYLGAIAGKRFRLKRERHKILWGNAISYQREIREMNAAIQQAIHENLPRRSVRVLYDSLRAIRLEYGDLLSKINREEPELETLVHVNPVRYEEVQEVLAPDEAILLYQCLPDTTYIWCLTRTTQQDNDASEARAGFSRGLAAVSLAVNRDSLRAAVKRVHHGLARGESIDCPDLLRQVLQPVGALPPGVRHVTVIPDDYLFWLPFNWALAQTSDASDSLSVVLNPSLSNYWFCYGKRKIGVRRTNMPASLAWQKAPWLAGYSVTSYDDGEFAEVEPTQHAIVHLSGRFSQDDYLPLTGELVEKGGRRVRLPQIYSWDMAAPLVVIDGLDFPSGPFDPVDFMYSLQRTFFYAGAPTIVVGLWSMDEAAGEAFFSHFYPELLGAPPARALAHAQSTLAGQGMPVAGWAGFQVVGYRGMSADEEAFFAERRLDETFAIGHAAYQRGQWEGAVRYLERALAMAELQGEKRKARTILEFLVESSAELADFDRALRHQTALKDLALESHDPDLLADSYQALVVFHTQQGDYEAAIDYQRRYLKMMADGGIAGEVAYSLYNLGLIHERAGEYDAAIDHFRQSAEHYAELGDPLGHVAALNGMGRVSLSKTDDYFGALRYLDAALELSDDADDPGIRVEVLQNLGLCYERLAQYPTAREHLAAALDILADHPAPEQEGLTRQYLANVNWKSGLFQDALREQRTALEIFEKLGNDQLKVLGLSTQGLIFMSLGEREKALDLEGQALGLASAREDSANMATILKNIGLIHQIAGEDAQALEQFRSALALDQKLGLTRGLAYGHRNVGSILRRLGQTEPARDHLDRALSLSQEIGDGRNEAQCLLELAYVNASEGQRPAALITLDRAARLADERLLDDIAWRVEKLRGDLLAEASPDLALTSYRSAIRIVERMRSQIKVEEYRSGFIDDKLAVYEAALDLLVHIGRPGEAYEIAERAKSRNFADLLANKDLAFTAPADSAQWGEYQSLQDLIREVQSELSLLRQKPRHTSEEAAKMADLAEELADLRSEYEAFLVRLKEANPEMARIVATEPLPLVELQRMLPDSTALLSYYVTDATTYLLLVSKNGVVARTSEVTRAELVELIGQFREAVDLKLDVTQATTALAQRLLTPVAREADRFRHLVISPHGVLHYFPFAALRMEDGRWLADRFELSIAPSGTVLGFCLQSGRPVSEFVELNTPLLALGNPQLGDPALDLPYSALEVDAVGRFFPSMDAHLREAATETVLRESAGRFPLILFSLHGQFDAANPLFSSLLLAPDSLNDGRLEAHEIFGLKLDAQLVAMSACETGLGKLTSGDEVIGLTRSFIFAGAPSLLASLWKVDDLATAVMVKRFFQYIADGHPRAEALRKAQRVVRQSVNSHPAYWAAFQIVGDFR